ncbi:hypothetical protein IFR05_011163 [Cadophora sp. M221]|nr:hypothetical protein IFR05_011163 [Cadophora sp. M221]
MRAEPKSSTEAEMPLEKLESNKRPNSQHDMLYKTRINTSQCFKHHDLGRVDKGDQGATIFDDWEIRPSGQPQNVQLRLPRTPLGSRCDRFRDDSDSSELSDISEISGMEIAGRSRAEGTPPLRKASLGMPIPLPRGDRGTSDISDLSGLSDFGEDDEAAVLLDAKRAEVVRINSHLVDTTPSLQYPQSIKPNSRQEGFTPRLQPSTEKVAVQDLREKCSQSNAQEPSWEPLATCLPQEDKSFIEFELSDFSIYLPDNKYHPFAMRGLQHLGVKVGNSKYLFDGVLSVGDTCHYVRGVPFKLRSIGNYGEDLHEVGSQIWIESELNSGANIFYRLGKPSAEYARYHAEFLWLADFAKHFVDYCQASVDSGQPITLHRFRRDFYLWLMKKHQTSLAFRAWCRLYNNRDFRSAVSTNINFLFLESMGIDQNLNSLPIWSAIMSQDIVPTQEIEEEKTIVTQYVYECFKDIRFGHHLKVIPPSFGQAYQGYTAIKLAASICIGSQQTTLENVQLGGVPTRSQSEEGAAVRTSHINSSVKRNISIKDIRVGDVLSVTKDGSQSVWKDEISRWKAADDCWYVYVQKVHHMDNGESTYDAIWLYKPSDTSCAKMKYPYPKELFLSDNCTCSKLRIAANEVLGVVDVRWHGQPSEAESSHFIRQTYLQNETFVTLDEGHKICEHLRVQQDTVHSKPPPKYPIGTTVLVPTRYKSKYGLEPYEIVNYTTEGLKQTAVLRRLRRRLDIDNTGEKNELVYTDQMEMVAVHKIQRTCLVRFYTNFDVTQKLIPAPYNRNGNGNAFYITTCLVETNGKKSLKPIGVDIPKDLIQGFDPLEPPARRVLNGLDLFCGGGNFGRGLEEGGAVRNRWAVDIDRNAIHTYNANVDESEPTKLFYGSVNDMLAQAIKGNPKNSDLIPLPGDVDFISAGSPCQGFSALNPDPNNEKGLRNQSLVASVAAYVDFYRPKYGILENVLSMAQRGRGRDEDVMSQLICAIVGLGYQVRLCVLDAWSCGSPQSRGRLFLEFAAPGLTPTEHPDLSHSHPPHAMSRGLGKLANGQAFGARRMGPTPFKWVTIEESIADLPAIGDGATYQCIPYPDHVMAGSLTEQLRARIESIPIHPRGMNLYKAWNDGQGPMTPEERARFGPVYKKDGTMKAMHKPLSMAYARVQPRGVFPCMTLAICPSDLYMGAGIHWDDNRMFTAMEGRRIQGVPDHEVFLGTASDVWKILGNSVNRNVSLALGLSLRDAWLANDSGINHTPISTKTTTALPAPTNSRNISLASRPKTPSKPRTIRRSTGRGVSARSPVPAPSPSGDSSNDESDLLEWTCNYIMSLDPLSYIQPDQTQDITANSTGTAGNPEKGKVSLKRPHIAFQESSMSPKEKSSKLARASTSASPTVQASRNANSDKLPLQRSGNIPTLATKPKKVARDSFRQTDLGYIPDEDESDGSRADPSEDSELEIIPASTVPKSKSRRPRKRLGGRSEKSSRSRRQAPLVISLLSDDEDEDEDVGFEQDRQDSGVWNKPSHRNKPWAPASSPSEHHPGNRVVSNVQRHHLPISRPLYPQGPRYIQHASLSHIPERTQYPPPYLNNTAYPSRNYYRPQPADIPNLPNRRIEHEERQNAPRAAQRPEYFQKEVEMRERANREAEKRDAEKREEEREQREMETQVPLKKYVPVDNGDLSMYFQTSRYMDARSGRAR